jgi:hypothetical protein
LFLYAPYRTSSATKGRTWAFTLSVPPLLTRREAHMSDLVMLCIGAGFFALALAYVTACERL